MMQRTVVAGGTPELTGQTVSGSRAIPSIASLDELATFCGQPVAVTRDGGNTWRIGSLANEPHRESSDPAVFSKVTGVAVFDPAVSNLEHGPAWIKRLAVRIGDFTQGDGGTILRDDFDKPGFRVRLASLEEIRAVESSGRVFRQMW